MYFVTPSFADLGINEVRVQLILEVAGRDPLTLQGMFEFGDDPTINSVSPTDGIVRYTCIVFHNRFARSK